MLMLSKMAMSIRKGEDAREHPQGEGDLLFPSMNSPLLPLLSKQLSPSFVEADCKINSAIITSVARCIRFNGASKHVL